MGLKKFGKFLKEARESVGHLSQASAAKELSAMLDRTVSQSVIAQYETGKVANPDPALVESMAELYRGDYLKFVFQLIKERFDLEKEGRSEEFQWRLRLLEAALKTRETVGEVEGLGCAQLKGKTGLLKRMEILDARGLADWLEHFPDLKEVWVVSPKYFEDNYETGQVICKKLVDGLKVCIFVDDENIDKGKNYRRYLNFQLEHKCGIKTKKARDRIIDSQVLDVSLNVGALRWLQMDYIIANPEPFFDGVGFGILLEARSQAFAFRLDGTDLNRLLLALSQELWKVNEDWLPEAKKRQWFSK